MKRNALFAGLILITLGLASCGGEQKTEQSADTSFDAKTEVQKQEQAVSNDSGQVDPQKLEEMMKDAQ